MATSTRGRRDGTRRSTSASTAGTRERLIEAATELMWQHGIGEVSVDAILVRADALKGSFYHFFPTKADLLLECLDRIWDAQSAALSAIYADAPSAEEGLRRHLAMMFDEQRAAARRLGFVPGSFNYSMPTSVLREDPRIALRLRELMSSHRRHIETALAQVALDRPLRYSVEQAARLVSYLLGGAVLAARMENSLDPLADADLIVESVFQDSRSAPLPARRRRRTMS
jgi:TetR/AcrR family transcriptional repressor of nem operon